MVRSPIFRAVFAALLIIVIVVATFSYGNSQRAKQAHQKELARQEAVKKASEEDREAKKQQDQADAAAQSASTPAASNAADSSAVSPAAIPQTGANSLSFYLCVVVGIGLSGAALYRRQSASI